MRRPPGVLDETQVKTRDQGSAWGPARWGLTVLAVLLVAAYVGLPAALRLFVNHELARHNLPLHVGSVRAQLFKSALVFGDVQLRQGGRALVTWERADVGIDNGALLSGQLSIKDVRLSGARVALQALEPAALALSASERGVSSNLSGPFVMQALEFVDLSKRLGAPVVLRRVEIAQPNAVFNRDGSRLDILLELGNGSVAFSGHASTAQGRLLLQGGARIETVPGAALALLGSALDPSEQPAGAGSLSGVSELRLEHFPRQALFQLSIDLNVQADDLALRHAAFALSETDARFDGRIAMDWPLLATPTAASVAGRLNVAAGRLQTIQGAFAGIVARAESLELEGEFRRRAGSTAALPEFDGKLRARSIGIGPAVAGAWSLGLDAPRAQLSFERGDGADAQIVLRDFQAASVVSVNGEFESTLELLSGVKISATGLDLWTAEEPRAARLRITQRAGASTQTGLKVDELRLRALTAVPGGGWLVREFESARLARVGSNGVESLVVKGLSGRQMSKPQKQPVFIGSLSANSLTTRGQAVGVNLGKLRATGVALRDASLLAGSVAVEHGAATRAGDTIWSVRKLEASQIEADYLGANVRVKKAAIHAVRVKTARWGNLQLAQATLDTASFAPGSARVTRLSAAAGNLVVAANRSLAAKHMVIDNLARDSSSALTASGVRFASLDHRDAAGMSAVLDAVRWADFNWSEAEGLLTGEFAIDSAVQKRANGAELTLENVTGQAIRWQPGAHAAQIQGMLLERIKQDYPGSFSLEGLGVTVVGALSAGGGRIAAKGLEAKHVNLGAIDPNGSLHARFESMQASGWEAGFDHAVIASLRANAVKVRNSDDTFWAKFDVPRATGIAWSGPGQLKIDEIQSAGIEGKNVPGWNFRVSGMRLLDLGSAGAAGLGIRFAEFDTARVRAADDVVRADVGLLELHEIELRVERQRASRVLLSDAVIERNGRNEQARIGADRVAIRSLAVATDTVEIAAVHLVSLSGAVGFDSTGEWLGLLDPNAVSERVLPRLGIGKLSTSGQSRLALFDLHVDPPYRVLAQDVDLAIEDFHSVEPGHKSRVTFNARLGRLTTLASTTLLRPTISGFDWRTTGQLDGVDLGSLSPYAVALLDTELHAGRGQVMFRAELRDEEVDGSMQISVRGLRAAPALSATKDGAALAATLNLLKDRAGAMTLQVPLRGPIRNMRLRTGGALRAALQVAARQALARRLLPLGVELGGDQALVRRSTGSVRISPVYFEPGRVDTPAGVLKRLTALATELNEHPQTLVKLCAKAVASDAQARRPEGVPAGDWPLAVAAARAQTVQRYLVEVGHVPIGRFHACAPVVENSSTRRPRLEISLSAALR